MEWFLMLVIQTGVGHSTLKYSHEKPMTFQECKEAAKTFKAVSPTSGDAEVVMAVLCSKGKLQYHK